MGIETELFFVRPAPPVGDYLFDHYQMPHPALFAEPLMRLTALLVIVAVAGWTLFCLIKFWKNPSHFRKRH